MIEADRHYFRKLHVPHLHGDDAVIASAIYFATKTRQELLAAALSAFSASR